MAREQARPHEQEHEVAANTIYGCLLDCNTAFDVVPHEIILFTMGSKYAPVFCKTHIHLQ